MSIHAEWESILSSVISVKHIAKMQLLIDLQYVLKPAPKY